MGFRDGSSRLGGCLIDWEIFKVENIQDEDSIFRFQSKKKENCREI